MENTEQKTHHHRRKKCAVRDEKNVHEWIWKTLLHKMKNCTEVAKKNFVPNEKQCNLE